MGTKLPELPKQPTQNKEARRTVPLERCSRLDCRSRISPRGAGCLCQWNPLLASYITWYPAAPSPGTPGPRGSNPVQDLQPSASPQSPHSLTPAVNFGHRKITALLHCCRLAQPHRSPGREGGEDHGPEVWEEGPVVKEAAPDLSIGLQLPHDTFGTYLLCATGLWDSRNHFPRKERSCILFGTLQRLAFWENSHSGSSETCSVATETGWTPTHSILSALRLRGLRCLPHTIEWAGNAPGSETCHPARLLHGEDSVIACRRFLL